MTQTAPWWPAAANGAMMPFMSESDFNDPMQLAHDNLEEANRQLARATADFNAGKITQQRLDQLHELRDIAAADVNRVAKES